MWSTYKESDHAKNSNGIFMNKTNKQRPYDLYGCFKYLNLKFMKKESI